MDFADVLRRYGVTPGQISSFRRAGLLSPARDDGGNAEFSDRDCLRLEVILKAEHLGFTLDELKSIVGFRSKQKH